MAATGGIALNSKRRRSRCATAWLIPSAASSATFKGLARLCEASPGLRPASSQRCGIPNFYRDVCQSYFIQLNQEGEVEAGDRHGNECGSGMKSKRQRQIMF